MSRQESVRDPRRLGLVAVALCAVWLCGLVLGDLGGIGQIVFACLAVVAMLLVPLPTWQEAPERRWWVAAILVGGSLVVVAVATWARSR